MLPVEHNQASAVKAIILYFPYFVTCYFSLLPPGRLGPTCKLGISGSGKRTEADQPPSNIMKVSPCSTEGGFLLFFVHVTNCPGYLRYLCFEVDLHLPKLEGSPHPRVFASEEFAPGFLVRSGIVIYRLQYLTCLPSRYPPVWYLLGPTYLALGMGAVGSSGRS